MASLSLSTKLALATTILFLATSLMLQKQPIAGLGQETRLARRFGFGYGSPPFPALTTPPSLSSSGMLTDASTVDNSGKITSAQLPDAISEEVTFTALADAAIVDHSRITSSPASTTPPSRSSSGMLTDASTVDNSGKITSAQLLDAISEEVTFTALAEAAIVDHSRITSTPRVPVASVPAPGPSPREKSLMTKTMSVVFFVVFVLLFFYLMCMFVMGLMVPDELTAWGKQMTSWRDSYLTSENRFCIIARHNLGAIYNVGLGLFIMMLAVHYLWPVIALVGLAHTWAPDLEDMELLVAGMGAIVR